MYADKSATPLVFTGIVALDVYKRQDPYTDDQHDQPKDSGEHITVSIGNIGKQFYPSKNDKSCGKHFTYGILWNDLPKEVQEQLMDEEELPCP